MKKYAIATGLTFLIVFLGQLVANATETITWSMLQAAVVAAIAAAAADAIVYLKEMRDDLIELKEQNAALVKAMLKDD